MDDKKAEGMPINVIIIAIIALLVLVVLVAIFGKQMGLWGDNVNTVTDKNCASILVNGDYGVVKPSNEPCGEGYVVSYAMYKDVNSGFHCCLPTGQ